MTEQTTEDTLLNPLSEVTRKERRMLLGVSVVGIMVKTGLVPPMNISALGVEFGQINQRALLVMLTIITFYFLVAFVIYATADFLAWSRAYNQHQSSMIRDPKPQECIIGADSKELMEKADEFYNDLIQAETVKETKERKRENKEYMMLDKRQKKERILKGLLSPISIVRMLFEFLLPIFIGCYALYVLQLPAILTA